MSNAEKNPSENSLGKDTREQLQNVASHKPSVNFHQEDDMLEEFSDCWNEAEGSVMAI